MISFSGQLWKQFSHLAPRHRRGCGNRFYLGAASLPPSSSSSIIMHRPDARGHMDENVSASHCARVRRVVPFCVFSSSFRNMSFGEGELFIFLFCVLDDERLWQPEWKCTCPISLPPVFLALPSTVVVGYYFRLSKLSSINLAVFK